ncbi:MAG: hypothetical protein PF588_02390 [Candidatus Kapabacteria bacterium]|jgi:hypothetical protein|nr:hypothetical protein [Candidatus Kapabacteria bacterium]
MSEDIVIKNIRKSKLFIAVANILTSICFWLVYSITDETLYAVVSSILFLSSVIFVIIFSRIETNYRLKLIKLEEKKNEQIREES